MRLLFYCFIACSFSVTAQTTTLTVEKFIIASGGEDKWNKIESCKKTVKVWQNLNFNNLPNNKKSSIEGMSPSQHEITRMIPYFEVSKMISPQGTITKVYQNDQGSGILTSGMYFKNTSVGSFVTISLAKNILLLHKENLLSYQGERKMFDESCYVLRGPYVPESIDIVNFFFSKMTGLLIAIENENQQIRRITKFGDYQDVSGVTIPFKVESYAGDILFFKEVIEYIDFNQTVDKYVFYYREEVETDKIPKPVAGTVLNQSFKDGDLNELIRSVFKNKRVLVDLWATWCAPCKIEFKKCDSAFYKVLSANKVNLLYISIDKEKDRKKWESDISKFQLKGEHILAQKILLRSINELVYKNHDVIIPRYLVFDESGIMVSSDFVRPSDIDFERKLKSLF